MADDPNTATPSAQTGDTQLEVTPPPVENPEGGNGAPVETPGDDTGIAEPDSGSPSRAQARIEEQAAEKQALREVAEYWRQRALAGGEAPPASEPVADEKAPKFADFDSADDWAEAHASFVERRAEKRAEAKAQERLERERSESTAKANRTAFEEREEAFAKTVKGYREAVANPALSRYATPMISEIISTSELGPALSFHLANHPDKLARISRLTPAQQAAALGRLEAEISKAPATPDPVQKKQSTRAPAPPTPVGNSQPSKDMGEMSIDEYMAHRARGRKVIG